MNLQTKSDATNDIAYHFIGYTATQKPEDLGPLIIDRRAWCFVYYNDGKRYWEGMAELWSVALYSKRNRFVGVYV